MTDWLPGLPDFRYYGFQTGKTVDVRREDGREMEAIYHGHGIFRADGKEFEDVNAWRGHGKNNQ